MRLIKQNVLIEGLYFICVDGMMLISSCITLLLYGAQLQSVLSKLIEVQSRDDVSLDNINDT